MLVIVCTLCTICSVFLFCPQILNVQVPFIFKHLVNSLNDPSEYLTMLTAPNTIITVATALVLACKFTVGVFIYLYHSLAEGMF